MNTAATTQPEKPSVSFKGPNTVIHHTDGSEYPRRFDPLGSIEEIMETVTYHAPSPAQIEAINRVRQATANFFTTLREWVPASADRSAAVRHVREAMMSANAAIVLEGKI